MTIRVFLAGTITGIVISWGIFYLIINSLDPHQAGPLGFILFFLSFFLAIASTAALIGYFVRRVLFIRQLPAYSVRPSVRQGVWLALFFDLLLFLQLLRLLHWWVAFIVVLLFLSLEVLFLSYDRTLEQRSHASPEGQE